MQRTSCEGVFRDQNWVKFDYGSPETEFRLRAELLRPGCAHLRVLHRIPLDPDTGLFEIATSDFTHYALRENEVATLVFRRPAAADAFAVAFYAGCRVASAIKSYVLEELVELSD
jgi:hypothetical protein